MIKKREIFCNYQPYIDLPPPQMRGKALYEQAASNDTVTVNAWRDVWIRNAKTNHAKFGSFASRGLGKLWGKHRNLPAIVIGSGPSLKENAAVLKENPGIPVVSCLHNFHFLEDLGVKVDYYVSLDAGPITIDEVSEGGTKTADEYWAMTKDKTLVCFVSTDPRLLELWQGEIYFFSCPVPDENVLKAYDELEEFHTCLSTGGNVLGAALYVAKCIFGCNPIAFMGADFSFSYNEKFHGWDSRYDKDLGHYITAVDVFGNTVKTWQSYHNFKCFFDWVSQQVPGFYVNCTEGGTFGAYREGNIRSVHQMTLGDFFKMYKICENTKEQCENPATKTVTIVY